MRLLVRRAGFQQISFELRSSEREGNYRVRATKPNPSHPSSSSTGAHASRVVAKEQFPRSPARELELSVKFFCPQGELFRVPGARLWCCGRLKFTEPEPRSRRRSSSIVHGWHPPFERRAAATEAQQSHRVLQRGFSCKQHAEGAKAGYTRA